MSETGTGVANDCFSPLMDLGARADSEKNVEWVTFSFGVLGLIIATSLLLVTFLRHQIPSVLPFPSLNAVLGIRCHNACENVILVCGSCGF